MSASRASVSESRECLPPSVAALLRTADIWPSKLGTARHARLTDWERELYFWILRRFATSSSPSGAETREATERLGLDVERALETFAREDLVHLDREGKITVAYPFSGHPTAHRVRFQGGHEAYAMCAIDALGMAPMFGEPIKISSRDPLTEEEIWVELEAEGVGRWQPEEAVVVCGARGSGESCCSCCPALNFFASTMNAERWLAAHPDVHGTVISLPDAIVAGRSVFGNLLKQA